MQNKVINYIFTKHLPIKQEERLIEMLYDIGCNVTRTEPDNFIVATCYSGFQCGFVSALIKGVVDENRLYLLA